MADQVLIQIRMDSELKEQAVEIFDRIGIDMSTAVRMFFKATVREQQLPFSTNVADKGAEKTLAMQMLDLYKKSAVYEPPIADDENIITVLPLENGQIPLSMFVQLVTKIPKGKVSQWKLVFACLSKIYGVEVTRLPQSIIPYQDIYDNFIPYWRLVGEGGIIGDGRGGSRESVRATLLDEGVPVVQRGKLENSFRVDNYKDYLFDFSSLTTINQ